MSNCGKFYVHPPGNPSKWGVVDVGLKCPHSCVHCYYAFMPDGTEQPKKFMGMRKAEWKQTELLIAQVDQMADNGFLGFDITGGEPSIHPGIVDVVKHATDRGLSSRMITLGQFLTRKGLLEDLLKAGLTDVLFSYHSADADIFKSITGGSIDKMHDAMTALDSLGFEYCTNTVCIDQNYKDLPHIARSVIERNVYKSNFILMNAFYGWADGRAKDVQGRYSQVAPYLREAIDILENEGSVAVNVRYAPLCTMAGLERNLVGGLGVRYDPHEWMNTVRHSGPGAGREEGYWLNAKRGEVPLGMGIVMHPETGLPMGRGHGTSISKRFADKCANCSAIKVCDGIDHNYLANAGDGEFVPYFGDERGELLDRERLGYLPAHVIKRHPEGKVREVVARLMGKRPISTRPLVSVIVANFNYGKYLTKCLDALLAQTWNNIEVIVVDDCSTDDSRAVLAGYEDRCTVIYRAENSGNPAYPRNDGAKVAKGELMMIMDPDDWLESSYIEEAVRTLRKHPEASIAYPGTSVTGLSKTEFAAAPYDVHRELANNFIPYCAVYRRQMWEDAGGYVTNTKGACDYNIWVAGARHGHYGVPIPRQLFHYLAKPGGLFESAARERIDGLHKQIVLNNLDVYSIEDIQWALGAQTRGPETAMEVMARLEQTATDTAIEANLDALAAGNVDMSWMVYKLVSDNLPRAAFLQSRKLAVAGNLNPIVAVGLLFGAPEDDFDSPIFKQLLTALPGSAASLDRPARHMFYMSLLIPASRHLVAAGRKALLAHFVAMMEGGLDAFEDGDESRDVLKECIATFRAQLVQEKLSS